MNPREITVTADVHVSRLRPPTIEEKIVDQRIKMKIQEMFDERLPMFCKQIAALCDMERPE